MSINIKQLQPYLDNGIDLIPVHVWNKMVKGVVRGKTPSDMDWPTRTYSKEQIQKAVKSGKNMGFRIGASDLVVDMDPRNYDGTDCEELIADLFGYFDFDEMVEDNTSVRTGGGGYHVYFTLPEDTDYRLLRETLEEYPGVEFKRKGRQVLCAGSKHPSGEYYIWITNQKPTVTPQQVLDKIGRLANKKSTDYSSGAGALSGQQLTDLILDHLDPQDYQTNDTWFPILCGAHHATDGDGIEEFVEWSTSDPEFADNENVIRQRWESLWDKPSSVTIGTLIHMIEKKGGDSSGVKAVLAFSEDSVMDEDEDFDNDGLDEFDVDSAIGDINADDVMSEKAPEGAGVEGAALKMAKQLNDTSPETDVMTCIRLIKAANSIEAERSIDMMAKNKVLSKTGIKKQLNNLDSKLADDIARILAEKTLKNVFNKAKHLMLPPSGILHSYGGKYWSEMSEDFFGKILTQVNDKIKEKMDLDVQENSLITQALSISKRLVSTHKDRLHKTGAVKGIINCSNGELHITDEGGHTLKPHSYKSGLLSCLDVEYRPGASCPLFMETLHEIFEDFDDTEEMVNHIGEILGYCIQPKKNIASWWLFRGPGGDGKSTILSILGGILGDAQMKTSTKVLSLNEDNSSNNHTSAGLIGKLNVVIEELPAGYLLKDAGLKMLSETTRMEANPKFGKAFPFTYCGMVIMCSNGYPATRDLSHGMQRRANVIPFNRQFTLTGSEDRNRVSKILEDKAEMSGVLNFMLEGLQRLRDRGNFLPPESCEVAKKEWAGEANPVTRYAQEMIEKSGDTKLKTPFHEVYDSYRTWCEINYLKAKGKNTFKNDLVAVNFSVHKGGKNKMYLFGAEVKQQGIEDFDEEEEW